MASFKLKEMASKGVGYVRSYWSKPREGESVSIKEFLSLGGSAMGIELLYHTTTGIAFSGSSIIVGMIMGVGIRDAYVIGIIGTIIGYILLPFGAFIIDSLGQLNKKNMRLLHTASLTVLGLALLLWLVPQSISAQLDILVRDLPKHIAIRLFFTVFSNYAGTYVLRWFGGKHGKFKPFLIFFGLPTLVISTIIVYLPYQSMNYSTLLLTMHSMICLLDAFREPFKNNIGSLQAVMTHNPEERTRIYSVMPVMTGALRTLFLILLPMIAQAFGGQLNITSYRYVIPLIGGIGLLESYLVLNVKDRVVQARGHRPEVKMTKTAKAVFSNKYLWILNISNLFTNFVYMNDNVFTWLALYGTRVEWAMGLLLNISYLPATPGNLVVPWLLKRMDKRRALLLLRMVRTSMEILQIGIIFLPSDTMKITGFLAITFVGSFFNGADAVVLSSIGPDIWDYQQWKSGERLEASMSLFGFINKPAEMLIGMLAPFVLKLFGLVRDWDILYDQGLRNDIITVHMVFAIVGSILTLVPFFFYDLSADKLREINADLRKRAQAEQGGEAHA